MDTFEQAVDAYHATLKEVIKGNPGPTLELWSQRDDVVLCNPFHPFAHGTAEVEETTKAAVSNFAGGELDSELEQKYVSPDLACIVEVERFKGMIGGKEGSGALRVTTIFRREEVGWRICHRHADPITAPQAVGSILQK
jgi:ketosteroid isomerase-like protein